MTHFFKFINILEFEIQFKTINSAIFNYLILQGGSLPM